MRSIFTLILVSAVMLVGGCGTMRATDLMPSSKTQTIGGADWSNYEAVSKTYDTIVVGKTTKADLAKMSIILPRGPNVTSYNTRQIVRTFLVDGANSGGKQLVKLTPAIEACMDLTRKTPCEAYDVTAAGRMTEGQGSFILRVIGFETANRIVEWTGTIYLLLDNDVVVYADISGTPIGRVMIEKKRTPLGPLKGLKDLKAD
jgi:hypothetical protein